MSAVSPFYIPVNTKKTQGGTNLNGKYIEIPVVNTYKTIEWSGGRQREAWRVVTASAPRINLLFSGLFSTIISVKYILDCKKSLEKGEPPASRARTDTRLAATVDGTLRPPPPPPNEVGAAAAASTASTVAFVCLTA